jgi:F0F1-type ATP synthase membrane subunit c/vacuolar-type H+-ATPase subunit K
MKNQKGNTIPITGACELGSGIFAEKVAGGGAEAAAPNPSLSSSKKLRYSLSNTLP